MATDDLHELADQMEGLVSGPVEIYEALTIARLVWPSFVRVKGVLLLDFIAARAQKSNSLGPGSNVSASERAVQENLNFVEVAYYFARQDTLRDTSDLERGFAQMLGESWTARLVSLGLHDDYEVVVSEWFAKDEWTVLILRRLDEMNASSSITCPDERS